MAGVGAPSELPVAGAGRLAEGVFSEGVLLAGLLLAGTPAFGDGCGVVQPSITALNAAAYQANGGQTLLNMSIFTPAHL
jgi:hypothetical protein